MQMSFAVGPTPIAVSSATTVSAMFCVVTQTGIV